MFKRIVLMAAVALWLAMPVAVRAADTHTEGAAHTANEAAKTAANVPNESAAAVEGEAHVGHGGHEKPPLIPDPGKRETQLQALWVVIIFLVLLAILYPTAWKQVLVGLKQREQRIRQDIAEAEAARKKAEATLGEYNQRLATAEQQVRELIAKAQADGEKIATNIRMQTQQESEEIKERATKEIDAARKQAMTEFRQYAATVATAAAEQILRRNLNADDQRDLVNRSLDQLQAVNS